MAKPKMLWLRLYTEVLGDPKVQRLPPSVFKTWINLLIVAKLNDDNGRIPESMDDLAFQLHLSAMKAKEHIEILTKAGLIDNGAMHAWKDRQYESDTDPTRFDRVRRFREKHKEGETDVKRVSDAFQETVETDVETDVETQKKRNETGADSETDTDTEKDKNVRGPQAAATPFPRFIPPTIQEVREYCAERKNIVDPSRFIDFYTSKGWLVGKAKMRDWRAAVRNWEKPRDGEKPTKKDSCPTFDIQEG